MQKKLCLLASSGTITKDSDMKPRGCSIENYIDIPSYELQNEHALYGILFIVWNRFIFEKLQTNDNARQRA